MERAIRLSRKAPREIAFLVVKGRVEVKQNLNFFIIKSLDVFTPGDFFGEMALVMDDGVRNASVISLEEDTVCAEFSKSFFTFLIENVPKTAASVLRKISERNRSGSKSMMADLDNSFRAIIHGMGVIAEYRDPDTSTHLKRVGMYCTVLSQWLMGKPGFQQIDGSFVKMVGLSSPLHDVGKVGIIDSILLKPGKLDAKEWEIMKKHSIYGGDAVQKTLAQFCYPQFLEMGRNIALYHHEKWEGSGYPEGLKGEAIPLEARIMALADVYDACRSRRCYKEPFSHEKTRDIIYDLESNHLDGRMVREFVHLETTFKRIWDDHKEEL